MSTTATNQGHHLMAGHPDVTEIRDRLDRVAETPLAGTVAGMTVLAGVYAAISPWVVGFNGPNASLTASNLIVGLAAALLALELGSMYSRAHGISWVLPILGVWVIISQWVIAGAVTDTAVMVNNIVAGAVIVVFGGAAMMLQRMRMPQHQ